MRKGKVHSSLSLVLEEHVSLVSLPIWEADRGDRVGAVEYGEPSWNQCTSIRHDGTAG